MTHLCHIAMLYTQFLHLGYITLFYINYAVYTY